VKGVGQPPTDLAAKQAAINLLDALNQPKIKA
jgi:hypothetical protein